MSDFARRTVTPLASLLLAVGCTVQPPVPAPPPLPSQAVAVSDSWSFLHAPRLDSLIRLSWQRHPSVQAASATLAQSEALLAARRGATQWPQVDAGLTAQRQRFNPAVLGQEASAREFTLVSASVGARYTVDLFGSNRQLITALRSRVDLRRFELESAQSALAAAITTGVLNRAWQSAVLDGWTHIESLEATRVAMLREQLRLGGASPEAVAAQERALESARVARLRQARVVAESENLLFVLIGIRPGSAPLPSFEMADFAPALTRVDSIPSTLLLARPDVRAADAAMRAAHAEYGATVARAYPQLQLSASTATQALAGAGLFGPGSAIYSLVSQLSQPLLQRGLPAEKRAARAGFEAAFAHYESVVLDSWRDVSDLLVALTLRELEVAALTRSDSSAQTTLARRRRQVELGTASRWQLVGAEYAAEQARISLRLGQLQRLADRVAWYHAVPGADAAGF